MLGTLPPPPPQPDCSEQLCNRAIDNAVVCIKEGSCAAGVGTCEHAIAVTPSPLLPLLLALVRSCGWPPSLVYASMAKVKKRKSWDRVYYLKKSYV